MAMKLSLTANVSCGQGTRFVSWSPDGKYLAGVPHCASDRIDVWDTEERKYIANDRMVNIAGQCWSPDGDSLFVGSSQGRACFVATDALGQCMGGGDGIDEDEDTTILHSAWSPTGKHIVYTLANNIPVIWSVEEKKMVGGIKKNNLPGGREGFSQTIWSPDGKRLATVCFAGIIRTYQFSLYGFPGALTQQRLFGTQHLQNGVISCIAWSPCGRYLAAGLYNGSLVILDSLTLATLLDIPAHPRAIYAVDWHPGGKILVTCGSDGLLKMWDVSCVAQTRVIYSLLDDESVFADIVATHAGPMNHNLFGIAWSPCGKRLAVAGRLQRNRAWLVRLWSCDSGDVGERLSSQGMSHNTAANLAADVLQGMIPSGVLADFLEDGELDVTGHQVQQLRWGNLFPAGYWARQGTPK